MNDEYEFLTYKEVAKKLNITIDAARLKANRNHWPKRKNNRKQLIVGVPKVIIEDQSKIDPLRSPENSNELQETKVKLAVTEEKLRAAVEKFEIVDNQNKELIKIIDKIQNKRHWWQFRK